MQPPPLPPTPPPPRRRPIRRAVFQEALGFRLGAVTFDYSIIERSHAQAERWLNANAQVEVIQIQSFHSTVLAVTVVWYREGEPHA